ncbi:MAG: carboxypeptidase-like regulatory domain-containing protein [Bacteroidia bacterium]|nr:carboxypeptidase-like regulatory domain-containing protein [Bacteroidia bacterium]
MRGVLLGILSLLGGLYAHAYQIHGKVVYSGEPLGYASIHVKGSTQDGVISNGKGDFYMELPGGTYTLVCEFVGMKAVEKTIKVTGNMTVNFEMFDEEEQLSTLVIDANDEDPSYKIIRSAIKRKQSLNKELNAFTHNLYIKASLEKEDLSKPDTTSASLATKKRVNFIESYSKVYHRNGQIKEVKKAYKDLAEKKNTNQVTISFNEQDATQSSSVINPELYFTKVTDGDFDFLKNRMSLPVLSEMPITSPISNNAFLSYKFKLLETFYEGDDFIAKIRVTPKFDRGALFAGVIYVSKKTFTLKSVDLSINDATLSFFDNFNVIQDFTLVDSNKLMIKRQEFYYGTRSGKKKSTYGHTLATYDNYAYNVQISPKFMNRGQIVYEDESYDASVDFWKTVRPTGLKKIEQEFIRVQDSIKEYHESDAYLDMQDSINNDLGIWDYLLNGIVHRNHRKGTRYYILPLSQQIQINNIDGYRHTLGGSFTKRWKKEKDLRLNGGLSYGITNENFRGRIQARFMYDPKTFSRVRVYYANQYKMINDRASIAGTLSPSNFAENKGYGIGHEREWLNGFFVRAYLDYDQYAPFEGKQLDELWEVFPNFSEAQDFDPFEELVLRINARITFKQKYEMLPYKKVITGSRYPVLELTYNKGIKPFLKSDVNYDYLQLATKYTFKLFKIGTTRTEFQAGRFINDREVRLSGLKYIRGSDKYYFSNPLQTPQLIQSVGYQTAKAYAQGGLMHHFNGQILKKVPILKHTGLQLAGGAFGLLMEGGYLTQGSESTSGAIQHGELIAGVERPFRLWKQMFRIGTYYAVSQNSQDGFNQGFKIGIDFYNPVSKLWQY